MNLHLEFVNLHCCFSWICTQFTSLHFAFKDIFLILIAFGWLNSFGVSQYVSVRDTLLPSPILYPVANATAPTVERYVNSSNSVIVMG